MRKKKSRGWATGLFLRAKSDTAFAVIYNSRNSFQSTARRLTNTIHRIAMQRYDNPMDVAKRKNMFNNIKKNELSIMKETIKVKLSGGFHNSKSITLSIGFKVESLISYADGQTSLTELIDENLSSYQRKRLENHFCGIKGCTCGSWLRANVDDDSIKDIKGMVETILWLKNRRPSTIYEKCDMLGGEHGQYEIKDPKEFAERYMKENGYTRYEIITCGKFSELPSVYFSNDERAIGFFKN